jgi:hypothetical protein
MSGRLYLTRQAAALLRYSKLTSNPKLAASFIQKAADLKARIDAVVSPKDEQSPLPPDVEAETRKDACP